MTYYAGTYQQYFRNNTNAPTRIVQLEKPREEPLTLKEVRTFGRIEHNVEDSLLDSLIVAARQACESYTNRSIINQQWEMSFNYFPWGVDIPLRRGPVTSIDEISYTDVDGQFHIVDPDHYFLTDENLHGRIVLKYGLIWETPVLEYINGLNVKFTAGYGDHHFDVPELLRLGMQQYCLNLYEMRDDDVLSMGVKQKWDPYRLIELR